MKREKIRRRCSSALASLPVLVDIIAEVDDEIMLVFPGSVAVYVEVTVCYVK